MQVALTDMLYTKSLKISSGVKSEYGIGAITNLQSNDAAKLYKLPQYSRKEALVQGRERR